MIVRFVIGHTTETQQEEALALEEGNYGGFLRLPIQVGIDNSIYKHIKHFYVVWARELWLR